MAGRLTVVQADITTMAVDAIVNAANRALAPGAGIDGAIRRAAGPRITEATARIGGCETGEACITDGFDLPARHVIHTVGPIWRGGRDGEAERLASCYRACLSLARDHDLLVTVHKRGVLPGSWAGHKRRVRGWCNF